MIKGLGFRTSELTDTFRNFINQKLFDDIASWNFNTVKFSPRIDILQPTQRESLNEDSAQRIDSFLDMAHKSRLKVIISVNMAGGNGLWGMSQPDALVYLSQNPEALIDWEDYIVKIIQRWNSHPAIIGFNGWDFPFHGYEGMWSDPTWKNSFYMNWTPKMYQTIRSYSNKTIFYSPCYQGGGEVTEPYDGLDPLGIYSGAYGPDADNDTSAFNIPENFGPMLDDENVIYCHRYHRPRWVERNSPWYDWDYPYEDRLSYLMWNLYPALNFRRTYGKKTMIWEWQTFRDDTYDPTTYEGGYTEARLNNYLRTKLELSKKLQYDWIFMTVRPGGEDGIFNARYGSVWDPYNLEQFPPAKTVEILREYTTPTFPWGTLIRTIGPIGVGLYFIGRTPRRG